MTDDIKRCTLADETGGQPIGDMRSRFLIDLTTPEVERYFAKGGRTAILPVGSVEMHGPHQPLGTDTFIAKAFSLRLAQETEGIVLPEIQYTWAGATDGFAGTFSIDAGLVQKLVEAVLAGADRMGFRRLAVISVHAPNSKILFGSVRGIYERLHIPVFFADPFEPYDRETARIFEGDYEISKEASLVLGSLKILGMPELYSQGEMSYDDQAPAFSDSLARLMRMGTIGYFMRDVRQHACPSKYVSTEKGLEFIERQVAQLIPVMADLDIYCEESARQANRGRRKAES